jgi:hypothetical protein
VSNTPFENHDTLWVLHISNDDRMAIRAKAEGFICIGWGKLGDLRQYTTREKLKEAMARAWSPRFSRQWVTRRR